MRPLLFGICLATVALGQSAFAEEMPHVVPAPALDNPLAPGAAQTIVLAGGCYWGVQGIFEHVKGVQSVTAGFEGHPSISDEDDLMRRANSGPAEAVKIVFDPSQISVGQLLQVYFSVVHDPTEVNRQGPDVGAQYRSEIFYEDSSQRKIAEAYIDQINKSGTFHEPLATQASDERHFERVPESQQDYMIKHSDTPYVQHNDLPRLAALKALFPARYQEKPTGPAAD